MPRPWELDDNDPATRDRFYFYFALDCIVSVLLGIALATLLSSLLWIPNPPPEEARVICNSAQPYHVTEREHLHLGHVYMNSHYYTRGHHPSVQKQLAVDVSYVVHPVVCQRAGLNWTLLRIEDAFVAGDPALAVAIKGVKLWHNETRYTYDGCRWRDCLYSEPAGAGWWWWFGLWMTGILLSAVTAIMLLWPCGTLHNHYVRWKLYEAWQRLLAQRRTPKDATWQSDCV